MQRTRPQILLLVLLVYSAGAIDELSVFNYQGRLAQNNQAANGLYDFQLRLADAGTNGNYLGALLTRNAVPVTNGVFQLSLHFGDDVFNGSARWLEIAVRTNSSSSFTVLSPRQAISANPYASFARSAGLAANLAEGGATLTNISGSQILPGSISSNQISAATDAAYRAINTNLVRAIIGVTNPVSIINVKDYGAVGDGVTDDTAALSNAWNTFVAVGGTLYLPPGTYLDSGTHTNAGWINPGAFANAGYYRDGRLVWGAGRAIWRYTGSSRMFALRDSAPDFDGIWFEGSGTSATNCIFATTLYNKWIMRNCFFANWTTTTAGALTADDADSINLSDIHFVRCNIGLGIGFKCSNLKADIRGDWCGTVVAAGVPTRSPPGQLGSASVDLNVASIYSGTALAVNAGGQISARIYSWYNTNGAVWLGAIASIGTNTETIQCLTIHDSWFNNGSTAAESPVLLWQQPVFMLRLQNSHFDYSGLAPKPVIKSLTSNSDRARIEWSGSLANRTDNFSTLVPVFQDSAGTNFPDQSLVHDMSINRGLDIYNKVDFSGPTFGGKYLLDVFDSVYPPGKDSLIARFGHSWTPGDFNDFWGGLVVRHDAGLNAPVVNVTNAILQVSGNRSAGSPVGSVTVANTVNATNGFLIGSVKILSGAGDPEGNVAAPAGSLYLRVDGGSSSTLYVKGSGTNNTGWIAK
jgi:hypothetical protein